VPPATMMSTFTRRRKLKRDVAPLDIAEVAHECLAESIVVRSSGPDLSVVRARLPQPGDLAAESA